MPASNEIVNNRPLSGSELRLIILNDVGNILDKDGMFAPHIGYGRVAYEVTVKLHIDNPLYPEHKTVIASRPPSSNDPDLTKKAIETAPLHNTSDESVALGLVRERTIESPNAARLEHELAVTIMRKDMETGTMKEERVTYDNKNLETDTSLVKDTDISKQVDEEWG